MGNAFNSLGEEVQPSVYLIHGFGGLGHVSMVCSLGVHPKGLGKVPRIKKKKKFEPSVAFKRGWGGKDSLLVPSLSLILISANYSWFMLEKRFLSFLSHFKPSS